MEGGKKETPTKLSRPPPSRSIAAVSWLWAGTVVDAPIMGGPRSILSRSPIRSPWLPCEGRMTVACCTGVEAGSLSGEVDPDLLTTTKLHN